MEKKLYLCPKPPKNSTFSEKISVFLHNLESKIFKNYVYYPASLKEFYENSCKIEDAYSILHNISFLEIKDYEIKVSFNEYTPFLGTSRLERKENHERTATLLDYSQDLEFKVSRCWDNYWFSMSEERWRKLEQLKPLESLIAMCTYIEQTPYLINFRTDEDLNNNKDKIFIPDYPKALVSSK